MSILITGGTGFLGSYLAKKLVEQGEDRLILMDTIPHPPAVEDIIDHVEIVPGDFSEPTHVMSILKKHDISCLFHFAYVSGGEMERSISQSIRINCEGTANLFEMARISGVQRVIWPSSGATRGRVLTSSAPELLDEDAPPEPGGLYGISKLFNENIAEVPMCLSHESASPRFRRFSCPAPISTGPSVL